LAARSIRRILDSLMKAYGPQHWWPAGSDFEVVVGAILTQSTSWRNVEKAIESLKRAGRLDQRWLARARLEEIAPLIRPAGFFNVKARRLRAVCAFLERRGGLRGMAGLPLAEVRASLLRVHGVGEETADSILLYALRKPVFVVDAYTRRIFSRMGLIDGEEDCEGIRKLVQSEIPPSRRSVRDCNELHALLVEHAKRHCRKAPRCEDCPLLRSCDFGLGRIRQAEPGRGTVKRTTSVAGRWGSSGARRRSRHRTRSPTPRDTRARRRRRLRGGRSASAP
jgi:endonuclease-3 related protein